MKKIFPQLYRLYYYPKLVLEKTNYDDYWMEKRGDNMGATNSFQKKRGDYIVSKIDAGSMVLDVGCGDGGVLLYMKKKKKFNAIGTDISEVALNYMQSQGVETIKFDVNDFEAVQDLPQVDYIMMLEVLEHMQNPEEFIRLIRPKANKAIYFSFPNTGYISHRLRLLFGSIPLQWRVHPGEHLRFWTYRDLKWWLNKLGLKSKSEIFVYKGVSIFNKIIPGLFGAAFVVEVKK